MEDEVPDPYCIVCGALVGFEDIYGNRRCRVAIIGEVELDPKNPLEWGSLYRAIFQRLPESRFELSGTGRYDAQFRDYLKVTWERDSSNIDEPRFEWDPNNSRKARLADGGREMHEYINEMNFLNSNNEPYYPQGRIVHARCWELVERKIGREVAEDHLQLLLEICRERFHENPYDIHEYVSYGEYSSGPSSQPSHRWWDPLQFLGSLDMVPHHPDVTTDPTRSIPLQDPLVIPDIPKLVRDSAQNKAREATKRKTRKWSSVTVSWPSSLNGRTRSPQFYQATQLPYELVFSILDNLSCHADIRNAPISFGWKVPDTYWKARVPRDLIFELEAAQQPPDELDWKFLFMGVLKLLQEPALRNRKRVLGLVDEIRRRLPGKIAKSKMPLGDPAKN